MYLVPLKEAVVKSLKAVFDGSYPNSDFDDVNVSIEYPMKLQNYPGVWVTFHETGPVERAGIAHTEIMQDDDGIWRQYGRWIFQGTVSLTVAALSSLERDRLFDQVVRVLMASDVDDSPAGRFRSLIENNDYLGIVINYDSIEVNGEAASPGTPWETNDVIYERTIDVTVFGEFVSDPSNDALIPLSNVIVTGYDDADPDNPFPSEGDDTPWDPDEWS